MSIRQLLMSSEYPKLDDFVVLKTSGISFDDLYMGNVIDFDEEDGKVKIIVFNIMKDTLFEAELDECQILTRQFDCELNYH
jgi:hypothetical protein